MRCESRHSARGLPTKDAPLFTTARMILDDAGVAWTLNNSAVAPNGFGPPAPTEAQMKRPSHRAPQGSMPPPLARYLHATTQPRSGAGNPPPRDRDDLVCAWTEHAARGGS